MGNIPFSVVIIGYPWNHTWLLEGCQQKHHPPPPPQEKQKRWVLKCTFPGTGKFFRALDRLEHSHHIGPNGHACGKMGIGLDVLGGVNMIVRSELKRWDLWKIFEEHLVISAVVAVGCCFKTTNKKPFLHLIAFVFSGLHTPKQNMPLENRQMEKESPIWHCPFYTAPGCKAIAAIACRVLARGSGGWEFGGSTQFLQIRLKNEANLVFFSVFQGSVVFVAPFFGIK